MTDRDWIHLANDNLHRGEWILIPTISVAWDGTWRGVMVQFGPWHKLWTWEASVRRGVDIRDKKP